MTASAAKDYQAVRAHVVTTSDGHLLNRCRHDLHGDAKEPLRYLGGTASDAYRAQGRGDLVELVARGFLVERKWEPVRCDASETERNVGQRELMRAGSPVAKRTWISPRAVRSHDQAFSLDFADRATSCGDGVRRTRRFLWWLLLRTPSPVASRSVTCANTVNILLSGRRHNWPEIFEDFFHPNHK